MPPDPLSSISATNFAYKPTVRSVIEAFMVEPSQMARYLATGRHIGAYGDWRPVHAGIPIANCGLRLKDEAVRVAVGMRLHA